MENPQPMARLLLLLPAIAALAACVAEPARRAEPPALALRAIMRDMGREAGAIAEGLLREDYALVEQAAGRIAAHPQPPVEERGRIITWLGPRAARFRGYDQEANTHAGTLAAAARARDARAALEAFHRMQGACMGCHTDFRQALLERFYPL